MKENKKENLVWYNNGNTLIDMILVTILLIIIFSQSFATSGGFSITLFGSIINHNSVYLFVLIYFILLKFEFGKKYFNYLNLILIFLYGLTTITSLITIVQAFSLNTVLEFTINFVLLVYLFHTVLRGTIVWKDFKLSNSPFNEFSNDTLYYIVVVISVVTLIVDLISTAVLRGIIISLLDAVFLILFGRYIFLYRKYLDEKKIDSNNKGNFDEVRKTIDETMDSAHGKVQEVLDKTDIDEKIKGVLDKTDIDEKIVEVKDMVVEEVKDTTEAAVKFVKEKTDTKEESEVKEKKKTTKKKTTTKKKGEKK